jgi:hypothetical protein
VARDPAVLGSLFARLFGAEQVRKSDDGCSLVAGLSRFDVITPAVLARQFGDAAPDGGGRGAFMAALTFRTLSLDRAAAALREGGVAGVRRENDRVLVPAASAFGAALEFYA